MSGAFPPDVRAAIWTRDAGCCALCGKTITGAYSVSHRRPRGMGGSRDPLTKTAANGVLLCGDGVSGCHGYVTSHVSWAKWNGHTVPQGCDPSLVPLWHARYGWCLLNADATYTPVDDPAPDETQVMEAFSRLRLDAGEVDAAAVAGVGLILLCAVAVGGFAVWLAVAAGPFFGVLFLAIGLVIGALLVLYGGKPR